MQTINIKTSITLTIAKLENFFEQLSEGLGIESNPEAITADLLAEKKVSILNKVFDLFDFTESVQSLADKDLEQFIDFLRDDFDKYTARKVFDNIPGFEVIETIGNYQVVKKNLFYLVVGQDGHLAIDSSWLHLEDAIAAAEQLATEV